MNIIVNSVMRDTSVRVFLFKYSAVTLGFGVATILSVLQSLAPLEHEVYKEFYLALAEVEIVKDCPQRSPEFVRASARLEAAGHSKALISSVTAAAEEIKKTCFFVWGAMFILAATHWFCSVIEGRNRGKP